MSDRFRPATYPVPASEALVEFMRTGWSDGDDQVERLDVVPWAAVRRSALAQRFSGERLVIPAGPLKSRANDTDYRFRADTAHVYYTGNQTSDAVLVMDDGEPTLFFRPRHAKNDDAFGATDGTAKRGQGGGCPSVRHKRSSGCPAATFTSYPTYSPPAARPACTVASTPTSTP